MDPKNIKKMLSRHILTEGFDFIIDLEMDNITSDVSDSGSGGALTLTYEFDGTPDYFNGTGGYSMTISIPPGGAGDQESRFGFFTQADNGNSFDLRIEYKYLIKIEE